MGASVRSWAGSLIGGGVSRKGDASNTDKVVSILTYLVHIYKVSLDMRKPSVYKGLCVLCPNVHKCSCAYRCVCAHARVRC